MTMRQNALQQAWGLHNSINELDPQHREPALLYLAYLWGTCQGYKEVPVVEKPNPTNVRKYCMAVIDDLSKEAA